GHTSGPPGEKKLWGANRGGVPSEGRGGGETPAIELRGQRKSEAVLADKGYDSDAIVVHVETMGAKAGLGTQEI
ncbi:MAG: hypothetical protein P4N59_15515, partial [Negativicutes bacterium]|nr:hypothetical protein [Negativicutes bacterium]